MDYTIPNNAKLFDDLVQILGKYSDVRGIGEALQDLRAAKVNYVQRSIDHMVICLILVVHDLVQHPLPGELKEDLRRAIREHYKRVTEAGSKLGELARQYEAGGGQLLSRDEILEEVDQRRGSTR